MILSGKSSAFDYGDASQKHDFPRNTASFGKAKSQYSHGASDCSGVAAGNTLEASLLDAPKCAAEAGNN